MCKSHERRKRDLAQKSANIQGIPGFWANVVYPFCYSLWSTAQEEGEVQRQEQEEGWRRGGRMVDPEGSVVLGNWQAPKAQLSRVRAGPHL